MTFPKPLVETRTVGRLTIHAIQAGGQRLDGGAMFGVVPKPLWERRIKADERNRIQLGMRCLVVEHPAGPIVIDTGAGNKEDAKFLDIYGIENEGADGRTALEDGLREIGLDSADVTMVINTHLHFDHAGGNTYADADGAIRLTFPNARYLVQKGEFRYATHPNERTGASYFARNYVPIQDAGQLDLVDGEKEVAPGIRLMPTPGHTPHHQSILIDGGDDRAIYLGDLVPTQWHLPLPWIMGYDVEPLVTLESKRSILARVAAEHWLAIFEHDAATSWGRVKHDGKSYGLEADTER